MTKKKKWMNKVGFIAVFLCASSSSVLAHAFDSIDCNVRNSLGHLPPVSPSARAVLCGDARHSVALWQKENDDQREIRSIELTIRDRETFSVLLWMDLEIVLEGGSSTSQRLAAEEYWFPGDHYMEIIE